MKNYLKISAVAAFVLIVSTSMAQSTDKGWPASKDVNRYSNKSLTSFKATKINSVGTPAIAKSKMQKSTSEATPGNVASAYPMWAVSKGVNRVGKK
jgi:hypothetical protein